MTMGPRLLFKSLTESTLYSRSEDRLRRMEYALSIQGSSGEEDCLGQRKLRDR